MSLVFSQNNNIHQLRNSWPWETNSTELSDVCSSRRPDIERSINTWHSYEHQFLAIGLRNLKHTVCIYGKLKFPGSSSSGPTILKDKRMSFCVSTCITWCSDTVRKIVVFLSEVG